MFCYAGLNLTESSEFNKFINCDSMTTLPYSSGTTGLPKGVMLSHNNITSNCEMIDTNLPYERVVKSTTNDYQDVIPCFLPFFHCYGLTVILFSKLALGCKIISIPKYEANEFLRIVKENKATILPLVPPTIIQLGNHEAVTPEHFKYVRQVMSAASTIAHADVERFKKKYVSNRKYFMFM